MCFGLASSLAFTVLGGGTAALLHHQGRAAFTANVLIYFALMELLQALHYLVLEEQVPWTMACMAGPLAR